MFECKCKVRDVFFGKVWIFCCIISVLNETTISCIEKEKFLCRIRIHVCTESKISKLNLFRPMQCAVTYT